ncbi:MAG TPA: hypothetical protein PKH64_10670 [Petrotogaceae bacterium]|jgi:hypothetical protein|nr:hypothetical protein [Petrotogaceae bacterium]HOG35068.1 hypothetical protein [Petrotogaceae bacterium]HPA94406.1 hypothetical protein [Petrotogaceae bacterium]HPX16297.1 hypothetical protein [Petrotogaceae bacterium]HQC40788.1 hypothetical protein [Petrotogaceae bacterium]
MRIRALVALVLLAFFLILSMLSKEEPYEEQVFILYSIGSGSIDRKFSNKELKKFMSAVLADDSKVDSIKLLRENSSVNNISTDFTLQVKQSLPSEGEFAYKTLICAESAEIAESIFDGKVFSLEYLWSMKDSFKSFMPDCIRFAGVRVKNGVKSAYIYFNDELLNVCEGEVIGDRQIMGIFDDGILVLTCGKEIEVIL